MKLVPDAADPVATLVFFLFVFTVVGVVFLFMHLVMGSAIRPSVPDAEKLTIYECGEPTVGSAWIQFDLRFYVVALLFVIFDVEVAFFFPWATVFGKANQLAHLEEPISTLLLQKKELHKRPIEKLSEDEKTELKTQMADIEVKLADGGLSDIQKQQKLLSEQLLPSGLSKKAKKDMKLATYEISEGPNKGIEVVIPITPEDAAAWAQIAFWDILVFFGVLLVGFAYVWRRGDIDWVRAYAHHVERPVEPEKPVEQQKLELTRN
jgi:NADH-quinone oxidoreductase subunit A